MPELISIDLEEVKSAKIRDFRQPAMKIVSKGRQQVDVFVNIDSLAVLADHHGKVDLRGEGKYLDVNLTGNADLDADSYPVYSAKVNMRHGCTAELSATEVDTEGSESTSRIRNFGNPLVTTKQQ